MNTARFALCTALLAACGGGSDAPDTDDPMVETDTSDTGTEVGAEAGLAALSLEGIDLFPAFDPDQRYYAVRAPDLPDAVVLEAIAADPDATVTVSHETVDGAALGLGAAGDTWALGPGERLVIEVAGAGGVERYGLFVVPGDVPQLDVVLAGEPTPGFTMLANFDFLDQPAWIGRYVLAVDPVGVPVWWRRHDSPSFDVRVSGGHLTYLGTEPGSPMEGLVLDPATHETVARFAPVKPWDLHSVGADPHEFLVLPDGNAIVVGIGGRAFDLSPWGGSVDGTVIDQVVQELAPDGSVQFEWTTRDVDLDDLPQALLDLIPVAPEFEIAHVNSVEIDPSDGNWVISMRLLSQVVKIARVETTWQGRTYAPGERLWTLGGPASDFAFVDDDREGGWQGFSEQHSARVLDGDRLVLFDNGTSMDLGRTGPARAVEYELDLDAMTATKVWDHALAGGGPAPAAGSVQRLSETRTLIGWGSHQLLDDGTKAPALSEVDADGVVVRELSLPENQWTYRAWHVGGDPLDGGLETW